MKLRIATNGQGKYRVEKFYKDSWWGAYDDHQFDSLESAKHHREQIEKANDDPFGTWQEVEA